MIQILGALNSGFIIGIQIKNGMGVTPMKATSPFGLKDGEQCSVVGGAHAGKAGTVRDVNTSETGHVTITVEQRNGQRFKTLAKNVVVRTGNGS